MFSCRFFRLLIFSFFSCLDFFDVFFSHYVFFSKTNSKFNKFGQDLPLNSILKISFFSYRFFLVFMSMWFSPTTRRIRGGRQHHPKGRCVPFSFGVVLLLRFFGVVLPFSPSTRGCVLLPPCLLLLLGVAALIIRETGASNLTSLKIPTSKESKEDVRDIVVKRKLGKLGMNEQPSRSHVCSSPRCKVSAASNTQFWQYLRKIDSVWPSPDGIHTDLILEKTVSSICGCGSVSRSTTRSA